MTHRSRALTAALASLALVSALAAMPRAGATVALRQRFFGHENVDAVTGAVRADRVILSWFGVTNFAAAIAGHVVLLDAWVPRGEYSGYVPTSPAELAALDPEYIFMGHGHFDHNADAAEIAVASGATVVGTSEHCAQARRQAAPAPVGCLTPFASNAPVGSVATLEGFWPGVGITIVRHLHSAGEAPDPNDTGGPHGPAAPPPDANAVIFHLPAPQDTVHLASHLADAEAGTLLYQFRIGAFALTWHDSSGPLKERAPAVLGTIGALPAPTDVQLGAIMGFNQITNGLRDPRHYIEALRPKIFVPTHHDNWAPGVSTRAENYRPIVEEELRRIPAEQRPILRFIGDPQDYVRPEVLTFDIGAPFWQ